MTNLRLPGQYDERLLGSLGLQGPYYNWNRWYLPGAGRYLEVDAIALRGDMNTEVTPDWYNYVEGNPMIHTDSFGLDRYAPCNDPSLSWLERRFCRWGVDRTCAINYVTNERCCDADKHDCYNRRPYGRDGWEEHINRCNLQYQQCVNRFREPRQ